MFNTGVCVILLINQRWPKIYTKSLYVNNLKNCSLTVPLSPPYEWLKLYYFRQEKEKRSKKEKKKFMVCVKCIYLKLVLPFLHIAFSRPLWDTAELGQKTLLLERTDFKQKLKNKIK